MNFSTIPSIPEMPNSIRIIRRAAQPATLCNNQIVQNDKISSDSNQSNPPSSINQLIDKGMIRAAKSGYDSTIHIIRFLLGEMNNSKSEDQRCEIAEKIFDILHKNPNILIYEPNFRIAVVNKLNEVQDIINKRSNNFEIEKQQRIIRMMSLSIRTNVRNLVMRQKIYKHLMKINNILKDYEEWSYGKSLKTKINCLNNTLELIKNNPNYVTSYPILN